MPTAYDLSSVIAGGSSVGHNNLIPLGEYPLGPMAWQGRTGMCQLNQCLVLCHHCCCHGHFFFLGTLALCASSPLFITIPPALPNIIHEWSGQGRLGAVTSASLPLSSLSLRS